jgi:hypothetical protein
MQHARIGVRRGIAEAQSARMVEVCMGTMIMIMIIVTGIIVILQCLHLHLLLMLLMLNHHEMTSLGILRRCQTVVGRLNRVQSRSIVAVAVVVAVIVVIHSISIVVSIVVVAIMVVVRRKMLRVWL